MTEWKSIPPAAVPVSACELFRGLAAGSPWSSAGNRIGSEIAGCFGGRHIFFLSSGKAALFLLLLALRDLKRREKVVIPGYTCFSVPSAIRKAGLKIVPCDVRSESLDFDYGQLEELADENTLCIVPTHLFGVRADVGRVREIADRKGIFVVEDSAQAFRLPGEEGNPAHGDAEFFSLGRGKNITCGSGGILLTGSDEIADSLRRHYAGLRMETSASAVRSLAELALMGVFMHPGLYRIPDSLPFLRIGETKYYEDYQILKMNIVKYGVMSGWRERLRSIGRKRTEAGERYKEALGIDRGFPIYSKPLPYLRFPVFMKDAQAKARVCGGYRHLGISAMYPAPIREIKEISGAVPQGYCPEAERISKTLVTLPTHHLVDDGIFEKIRSAVRDDIRRDFPGKADG